MKKLFLVFAVIGCTISSYAQKAHYQGEISLGYGIGLGDEAYDDSTLKSDMGRFHIETIHGVRISPHFFVGAGCALDLYSNGRANIPLFTAFKGYLTKETIATPYLFANLGYSFGDMRGFYAAGGIGVDFAVNKNKQGIFINLGYQSQSTPNNIGSNRLYNAANTGALLLQAGFRF